MALLAEEIVEEWLNCQGYFTIRGIKLGVQEIDLLAMKVTDEQIECRHIEVQASIRPVSYLSSVPREVQKKTGRAPMSAKKRSIDELKQGVQEWVEKKYLLKKKQKLRDALYPGVWSFELVVHKVKHPEELDLIAEQNVKIYRLHDVIEELSSEEFLIDSTSGAPLVDLILLE